jgi:Transposase domain (DUF772)
MMGQHPRTQSLFYYFRLEDQVPQDHLLRLIDRYVDFGFVRDRLKNFYSPTGRPSIDPEVLLRLLLVGYLQGVTSERRLPDSSHARNAVHIWAASAPRARAAIKTRASPAPPAAITGTSTPSLSLPHLADLWKRHRSTRHKAHHF